MKIYEITDKDLASFEAWLEVYLLHQLDNGTIQPAFTKVEIVDVLRRAFLTYKRTT